MSRLSALVPAFARFRGDDGYYLRSAAYAPMRKQRVQFLTDH